MIKRLEDTIFAVSEKLNSVSSVALTVMMGLVFINVLLRAVWRPLLGTYEITAFLASICISFALANCAAQKGHVAITLFTQNLSRQLQAVCGVIVALIGTGLFTVLAWESIKYGIALRKAGEVSMTLEISFYPFVFGMSFGLFMLALVNLVDLLNSIKEVIRR